ncbi:MAG: precorrin-6y C5,15-methyltransferase (decarboxylating) subunit CbiE, partial [Oscillospiraceae bacterium]
MKRNIFLIGTGMGCPASLTAEAQQAIAACSVLIGASRLLAPYEDIGKTLKSLVPAQEIADYIDLQPADAVVGVLLSGDVGFYSGAKGLYPLLEDCAVVTLPGVSSLVYFCAKLHTTWQDAALVSAHGRSHNAPGVIQSHGKTFVLTGGENRAQDLCKALVSRGLGAVQIHVGENLSYPQERITSGTAAELAEGDFDSLAVLLAENPAPVLREYTAPGIPDEAFLRGDAPMTKEEVRCLAISKLRLRADSVLWDVGAGTGSVSIEGALAAIEGQVFAVEKKPE